MNHWLSDNLKSRDASASKNLKNQQCILPAKLVVVEAHIRMCPGFFSGFVNSSDMYEEKVLQREASG